VRKLCRPRGWITELSICDVQVPTALKNAKHDELMLKLLASSNPAVGA
jgi:hypothetical protein